MVCPTCENDARLLPCPNCSPSLAARRAAYLARSAPVFVWTGSAEELAQAMAAVLDVEQLAALSGEVALAWRQKYHAIRTAEAQAKVDAEELEVLKNRPEELG